jgi:carbon storage regulator
LILAGPQGRGGYDFWQGGVRVLVLTRKTNQSIMIGDDVEVSVLAILGEKVRIGIEAPRSVPVFRKEVYVDLQRDQPEDRQEVDEALNRLKGDGD